MDRFYHRHLPHEIPDGVPFFITWNLKGAMPADAIGRLRAKRDRLRHQPPRQGELARDRRIRESKILFGMSDRFLDLATSGPLHLRDPLAAKIVEDAILFGAVTQPSQPEPRYTLYAWCVMGNHVHVLLKPAWDLVKIMQGIKGYTAHEINRLQGACGRAFWQDESFDHWVRDEEELGRIIAYIESNPVAAGMCQDPHEWPWSSARFRARWPVGEPFRVELLGDSGQ